MRRWERDLISVASGSECGLTFLAQRDNEGTCSMNPANCLHQTRGTSKPARNPGRFRSASTGFGSRRRQVSDSPVPRDGLQIGPSIVSIGNLPGSLEEQTVCSVQHMVCSVVTARPEGLDDGQMDAGRLPRAIEALTLVEVMEDDLSMRHRTVEIASGDCDAGQSGLSFETEIGLSEFPANDGRCLVGGLRFVEVPEADERMAEPEESFGFGFAVLVAALHGDPTLSVGSGCLPRAPSGRNPGEVHLGGRLAAAVAALHRPAQDL